MILSDKTIKYFVEEHKIIQPFDEGNLQPCSYDCTLGDSFIYPYESDEVKIIPDGKLLLVEPYDFLLVTTNETVKLDGNLTARVEGKSSLGRIGLLTHITAGFIDAGFQGKITLELCNLGSKPIALKKGSRICQLCFQYTDYSSDNPYDDERNHYQFQGTVQKSRYCLSEDGYYIVD